MALNEFEIEAFENIAQRLVTAELDVQFFIETYAANPDHAGEQLADLLNNLPVAPESKSQTKVNAFVGLHILLRTHKQISEILGDDMYMQELLDDHHQSDVDISDSLPTDSPTTRQQNKDIQRSARGGEETEDVDDEIRRESSRADDVVHSSFQQALHEPRDDKPLNPDQPKTLYKFDFSRLDPSQTFQTATRELVQAIMHEALSQRRLQPLYESNYKTEEDIDTLCLSLRMMVQQLRFDDGGSKDDDDDDDDDAGEEWKNL